MTGRLISSGPTLPGPVVLANAGVDGVPVVPSPNTLTRLHFFDGRLLDGDDLTVEQNAGRALDRLLAQSGGVGVAWGLDVDRSGETLSVSAGLGFDPRGNPLQLTTDVTLAVADLLGTPSTPQADSPTGDADFGPCRLGLPADVTVEPISAADVYLLTIGWVEGYCGTMDIYGSACEQACVGGTDRPFRVDGVVFRLRPVTVSAPLPASRTVALGATHLRSRLATAYFADEDALAGVPISAGSLASRAWCHGGIGPVGSEVPLALVVRRGGATVWIDEWVARRERMQTPARTGFDGRVAMRPRAVWSAQLAQFQCQLADRLAAGGLPGGARRLIDAGMVTLPPGGYLPIDRSADVVAQVTAMMGAGVDLRFLPVPVDVVPHEIESVRHRDRISLLAGLDDPATKPQVDILVPGGRSGSQPATGTGFRLTLRIAGGRSDELETVFNGTARLAPRGAGFTLTGAGVAGVTSQLGAQRMVSTLASVFGSAGPNEPAFERPVGSPQPVSVDALRSVAAAAGAFAAATRAGEQPAAPAAAFTRADAKPIVGRATLTLDADPWALEAADAAFVRLSFDVFTPAGETQALSFDLIGQLSLDPGSPTGTATTRLMRLVGQLSTRIGTANPRLSAVDLPARVGRAEIGGATQYAVTTPDDVTRTLRIGGTPLVVRADLSERDVLTLIEDPTALDPNSTARDSADVSLQLLRAARPEDAQFYDRTRLQAFGETGTLAAITAQTDWVAFKRRPPQQPGPEAPPRTLAVWVASVATPADAAVAQENLLHGQGGRVPWTVVAAVAFDPDDGRLTTSPVDLRAAYSATGAAATLQYVDFAPTAMPSSGTRVAAVLGALSPVAVPVAGRAVEAVSSPPARFVDPNTDGSIFLIAADRVRVRSPLLQVIGLNVNTDQQQVLVAVRSLGGANPKRDLLNALLPNLAVECGTIDMVDTELETEELDKVAAAVGALAPVRNVDRFPALILDQDWSNANPDAAKLAAVLTDKIIDVYGTANGIAPPPVRSVSTPFGTAPTPAVLVIGFVPVIG